MWDWSERSGEVRSIVILCGIGWRSRKVRAVVILCGMGWRSWKVRAVVILCGTGQRSGEVRGACMLTVLSPCTQLPPPRLNRTVLSYYTVTKAP